MGDCRLSRGVVPTDLALVLPESVIEALLTGLPLMDRRFGGQFLRDATLTGPEADDRPARRLQRLGLGVHGQRGGFGDSGHACGDSRRHVIHSPICAQPPARVFIPGGPGGSTDGRFGRRLRGPAAELSLRQHACVLVTGAR